MSKNFPIICILRKLVYNCVVKIFTRVRKPGFSINSFLFGQWKSLTSFADFLAFSYKIELNSSTVLSDSSKTVFKKTSIFEGLSGLFIVCTYLSSASTDHKNFSGRGSSWHWLMICELKHVQLIKTCIQTLFLVLHIYTFLLTVVHLSLNIPCSASISYRKKHA